MLEKITLENYRCYDHHSIEFKSLSIVVGKNNAGKSTLVEALRFVSLAVSRLKTSNYNPAPKWLDLPARARGVTPALKSFGFNTENLFHNYGNPPAEITAIFSGNLTVKIYLGPDAEIFCCLIDNADLYVVSRGAASKLEITTVNILPAITPIQKEE